MECEHFVYAPFNGVGYKLIKSSGVDNLITRKSLRHLKQLSGASPVQTWLPEKVVAISYLARRKDDHGRDAVYNHTILVGIEDYFRLNPPHQFGNHFITTLDKNVSSLDSLVI